jgi:hypothetical protein
VPGTADQNLRRANMHEDLGVYLLQGFASVAPVPRTQDVGIDAVATLLRRVDGRQLAADKTFAVQLKSASVRMLPFTGLQVAWLKEMQLPFFIGSVDTRNYSISLFTTHHVSRAFCEGDYEAIHVYLDPVEITVNQPSVRTVYLGAPVIAWDASRTYDADFLDWAYSLMKPVVDAEHESIKCRSLHLVSPITWKTNEPSSSNGAMMMFLPPVGEPQHAYQEILPSLRVITMECMTRGSEEDREDVRRFIAMLRRQGVEADPVRLLDSPLVLEGFRRLAAPPRTGPAVQPPDTEPPA